MGHKNKDILSKLKGRRSALCGGKLVAVEFLARRPLLVVEVVHTCLNFQGLGLSVMHSALVMTIDADGKMHVVVPMKTVVPFERKTGVAMRAGSAAGRKVGEGALWMPQEFPLLLDILHEKIG